MTNTTNPSPGPGESEQTRVLHRITPLPEWPTITDREPLMKIAVLDLETTGLDPRHDQILEFAAAMIEVDVGGQILSVLQLESGIIALRSFPFSQRARRRK